MDLLSDSMNIVAAECGVPTPSMWATNTGDSYIQIRNFLAQTARELLQRIDWQTCTLDYPINGSGVQSYDLPSDFLRATRGTNTVYGNSPQRWAFSPITTNGDWTRLQSWGSTSTYFYRFTGTDIEFSQTIASGDQITLAYVTKNWILNGSDRSATWVSDTNETYLPSRLLELGTIWRWKRKNGLEYNSYQGEYEIELTRYSNDDRQLQSIKFGTPESAVDTTFYNPYWMTPPGILGSN